MRGGGDCGVSANEHSCAHGAQINFGDLLHILTYMCDTDVSTHICSFCYLVFSTSYFWFSEDCETFTEFYHGFLLQNNFFAFSFSP
jgi:hypothetical protein